MSKRRRTTRRNSELQMDFIHRLPDDILVSIISRLKLEEAVRTSIVARRWQFLWTNSSCLDFNHYLLSTELGQIMDASIYEEQFVTWVNKVMDAYKGHTLLELKLNSIMEDPFYENDMDGWIKFAQEKHVQQLSMLFDGWESDCWRYKFPKMSESLHLESLRSLSLQRINAFDIEHVLSTCPLLEELIMESTTCKENLRVCGPLLMLKVLKLLCCTGLELVEVSAPNLTTFRYRGFAINIVLLEAPKLVKISLGGQYITNFQVHHCTSSPIPKCTLDLRNWRIQTLNVWLSPLILLANLKQLVLEICARSKCLFSCLSMINLSPMLRELQVKLKWEDRFGYVENPSMNMPEIAKLLFEEVGNVRHESLKSVKLLEFVGSKVEADLVLGLVSFAPSLNEMTIALPGRDLSSEVLSDFTLKSWANLQIERLKTKLPPQIQLIYVEDGPMEF